MHGKSLPDFALGLGRADVQQDESQNHEETAGPGFPAVGQESPNAGPASATGGGTVGRGRTELPDDADMIASRKLLNETDFALLEASGAACMVSPRNPKRIMWDVCVLMPLLCYIAIVMPYRIGLGVLATGNLQLFEICIDIVFMADIILNFRTG